MLQQIMDASLQVLRRVGYCLIQPTCTLCHAPGQAKRDLCAACEQSLPWLNQVCQRCALPLSGTEATICGQCLSQPPLFDRCIALFDFKAPVNQLVYGLKFHRQLHQARLLGDLLACRLNQAYAQQPLPQAIIPVPLHPARLRQRGFNQALELARLASRQLDCPLATTHVQRIIDTQQQTGLDAKQRRQNLRDAFQVQRALPSHVAIIDDVVTTTSTISALCHCLRQVGITTIDVWCIARTTLQ